MWGVSTDPGGKLTTYRELAADTVDELVDHLDGLPRSARRCRTARLRLRGAKSGDPAATGLTRHLADRFGAEASEVQAMIQADPTLGEPLVAGLPSVRAEALHAARHEMATTLDDVLARRTRARLQARDASAAASPAVAALIAPDLGWSAEETERQIAAYVALITEERDAPRLPTAIDGPAAVS